MPISTSQFKRAIEIELQAIVREAEKNISVGEVEGIGRKVIREILDRVSVGISPIAGAGRFPAYKAAAEKNAVAKEARKIDDPKRRKAFQKSIKKQSRKGYPYSVLGKHPGKQVRPVNLRLSGEFHKNLDAQGQVLPGRVILSIGFTDSESEAKERGHREGANGQPERPIIPVGQERFTPAIEKIMFDYFSALLLRAYNRVRRR